MKTWTAEEVIALAPNTISREQVTCMFGNKNTLTTEQILQSDAMSAYRRVWIAVSQDALPVCVVTGFIARTEVRAWKLSQGLFVQGDTYYAASLTAFHAAMDSVIDGDCNEGFRKETQQQVSDLLDLIESMK